MHGKHLLFLSVFLSIFLVVANCTKLAAPEKTGTLSQMSFGAWPADAAAALTTNLQNSGRWQVSQGQMKTIDIVSCPKITNFFGNNPASPYVAPFLPPIPGKSQPVLPAEYECIIDAQGKQPLFNLGKNDAVVILGTTPPLAKYFGFTQYVYSSYIRGAQYPFFASVMDSFNQLTLGTSNTPLVGPRDNGNSATAAFNSQYVFILSADAKTEASLRESLISIGIADSMINSMPLPGPLTEPGSDEKSDVFNILQRQAVPEDSEQLKAYLANVPTIPLRVTAKTSTNAETFPIIKYWPRGTGKTEEEIVPGVTQAKNRLVQAVRNAFPGYDVSESTAVPHIPEGIKCLNSKLLCLAKPKLQTHADNQDTAYQILGSTKLDENDFAIAVGVDHVATKQLRYNGIGIFNVALSLGVGGFTNSEYQGSAETFLPGGKFNEFLFAYKIARKCSGDFCYAVPVEFPGVPLEDTLRVVERAYLEPSTKKGPDPDELVQPTLLVFRPSH